MRQFVLRRLGMTLLLMWLRGEEILRRIAEYGAKFIPAFREYSQGRASQ